MSECFLETGRAASSLTNAKGQPLNHANGFHIRAAIIRDTLSRCRRVYWINGKKGGGPKISFASADGSEEGTFLDASAGMSDPRSLALDPWERMLYWADVDGNAGEFRIVRMSLDGDGGGGEPEVVCGGRGQSPFSLAVSRVSVVWTDWKNLAVWKVEKNGDGGEKCKPEAVKRLKSSRPMGVEFLTLDRPKTCRENRSSSSSSTLHIKTPKVDVAPTTQNATQNATKATKEEEEDESPCHNYCLYGGACSTTSLGVVFCTCGAGFTGDRCQTDACVNYCLAPASKCSIDAESGAPTCSCPSGRGGQRCQLDVAK